MANTTQIPTWLSESELLSYLQIGEAQLRSLLRACVLIPKIGVTGPMFHRSAVRIAERAEALKIAKLRQDYQRACINRRLRESQGSLSL